MRKVRRDGFDDEHTVRTVIKSFLRNYRIKGELSFVKDDSGSFGDSTVVVVVLNQELLKLQSNNDELWQNILQLIHLIGYTYMLEEGGTLLRILRN